MTKKIEKSAASSVRETTQKSPQPIAELEWGGFIDVRMTEELKEQFETWTSENTSLAWQEFLDCLGRGLKYSVSYDPVNMCFIASFTGQGAPSVDKRYCLTARAGNWQEATLLLLFKHLVLLDRDWGNFRPAGNRGLTWG